MLAPLEIVNVNLDADPLRLPDGTPGMDKYVVFWWRGVALGHCRVDTGRVPSGAADVAVLALDAIEPTLRAHCAEQDIAVPCQDSVQTGLSASERLVHWRASLQELERLWSAQRTDCSISVIICTRDRPEHLEVCLESIRRLSVKPDEVVVVDNAPSTDRTRRLVAGVANVRYVLEPRPGLDIARNTGIRESAGEIIAYVDDDVSVHPDWIDGLRRGFRDPAVMALTGLVLASELTTKSQLIFEQYWSFNRGYRPLIYAEEYFARYKRFGVPAWRIGAGANMAFRRGIFARVGAFDERLDVGAAGCSGDSEFWYRVLAEGCKCRYEPTAIVYHCHRSTMDGLRSQLFYYMRGHVAALLVRFERYGHWGNLIHTALLVPYYFSLVLFGWKQGRERYSTLWQEITGALAGVRFYMRNRDKKLDRGRI